MRKERIEGVGGRKSWAINICTKVLGYSSCSTFRVCTESWILEKVLKFAKQVEIEVRSGKMVKVWSFSFSKLQQVLTREYFSHSQIPFNLVCSKGIYYNHRMTSFRTLSCLHCTVITVRLQCIHEKKLCSCIFQGLY